MRESLGPRLTRGPFLPTIGRWFCAPGSLCISTLMVCCTRTRCSLRHTVHDWERSTAQQVTRFSSMRTCLQTRSKRSRLSTSCCRQRGLSLAASPTRRRSCRSDCSTASSGAHFTRSTRARTTFRRCLVVCKCGLTCCDVSPCTGSLSMTMRSAGRPGAATS